MTQWLVKLSLFMMLSLFVGNISAEETIEKHAQITVQTADVFKDLSPESFVIQRVYKNEIFDVIEARDTWVKIEIPNVGQGWIYRINCKTTPNKDDLDTGAHKTIIFISIVILALITGIFIFVKQQDKDESYI